MTILKQAARGGLFGLAGLLLAKKRKKKDTEAGNPSQMKPTRPTMRTPGPSAPTLPSQASDRAREAHAVAPGFTRAFHERSAAIDEERKKRRARMRTVAGFDRSSSPGFVKRRSV